MTTAAHHSQSPPQPPKRIVVCTDFSEASRQAVRVAGDLAAASEAEIRIVHAIDPMIMAIESPPVSLVDDAQQALDRMKESIASPQLKVSTEMRLARPWSAIDDAARDFDADLIVLASHGQGGLARLALGSTADRVLRSSGVPVLMVPVGRGADSPTLPSQWASAVVGVDFSEESALATNMAVRLLACSKQPQTTLALFHSVALMIEFRGADSPITLPRQWDEAETAAGRQLEALAAPLRRARLDVKTATFRGYATDGLLAEAKRHKADFIALGTHGRGAINRLLLGSVAESVVHRAHCPVLTVKHPDAVKAVQPKATESSVWLR